MDKTKIFQMRTDEGFLGRLDAWRRCQPDIPSRAESVRRLVEDGIEAEAWRNFARRISIMLGTAGASDPEIKRQARDIWKLFLEEIEDHEPPPKEGTTSDISERTIATIDKMIGAGQNLP